MIILTPTESSFSGQHTTRVENNSQYLLLDAMFFFVFFKLSRTNFYQTRCNNLVDGFLFSTDLHIERLNKTGRNPPYLLSSMHCSLDLDESIFRTGCHTTLIRYRNDSHVKHQRDDLREKQGERQGFPTLGGDYKTAHG